MELDDRIRSMLDKSDIWEVLQRCARGMDRHDAEMIAAAYHPGAIDDHGGFSGTADEFIAYVNGTDDSPGVHEQMFADHMHILGNHVCDLDGDVAHTETYVLMLGQYRGSAQAGLWGARYIDRFERRDGEWRIALRRVVMQTSGELSGAASAGSENLAQFVASKWDRSDISYDRPLEPRKALEAVAG